jgi:hypothetical protein
MKFKFWPDAKRGRVTEVDLYAGWFMHGPAGAVFSCPHAEAQKLIDAMWQAGMRPSHVALTADSKK